MGAALKMEGKGLTPDQVIGQVLGGQRHICQPGGLMPEEELRSTDALSKDPELYFRCPATAILAPDKVKPGKTDDQLILNRYFRSTKEKNSVLEDLKNGLSTLTKSSSLIDELISVADEAVTNALFNAPYVDPVTHVNQRIDRLTTVVDLPEDRSCRLFVAADDQRVVIGVQDMFGSLDVEAYLKGIKNHCAHNLSVNFGFGGAGIGSFIIYQSSSSMYLGVKPGETTVVIGVTPYRMSRKFRDVLPKHLHWVQTNKGG